MQINKQMLLAGVALASGTLAFILIPSGDVNTPSSPLEHPTPEVVASAPPASREILVAARLIETGETLNEGDVTWTAWPQDFVPEGAFIRSDENRTNYVGAIVGSPMARGDAVTTMRLNGTKAAFLASSLPAGRRAVSIPLDVSGARSAGGFIRPLDRVDVIAAAPRGATGQSAQARILMRNIRVLAIGGTVAGGQDEGQRTAQADTATLDVTPAQAEILAQAVKTNGTDLSLALRSSADPSSPEPDQGAFHFVRSGVVR
ncbi:Flp pilus assembly protein CpaB [Castellaniella sp.]|uniref:Flp pilus assembly protein CpaB n=2 Tax=Castellaniella sp. TaxID=1955812 RepID=UPI002AFE2C94|nr:Flp pilus assembly protein CpaB [Castellaniella sp.]